MTAIPNRRRPLSRRLARTVLSVLAILLAAAAVNVVGIWLLGDTNGWNRWRDEHAGYFAVWRGVLYVATASGWWWMRGRVLRREPEPETRARLVRAEIGAVLAVLTLEVMTFLQTR